MCVDNLRSALFSIKLIVLNHQIIYGILGTPITDLDYLTSCNAVRTNGSSTAAQAANANRELLDYLGKLVDVKTQKPGDDLISKLVVEQVQWFPVLHASFLHIR
jgi:hypothetical protein